MVSIIRLGKENRTLEHLNEKCLGCGICVDMCPTDSIKLGPVLPIARGLLKSDFININKDTCCLCGLCAFSCPFNTLKFKINDLDAKMLPNYPVWKHEASIKEDECIYCGRCVTACPKDAIHLNRNFPERKDLVCGEAKIDLEKCIFCGMCEEMCPADAINMKKNKKIDSSNPTIANDIDIDKSQCIYCGICKRVCPTDAVKVICTICMSQDELKDPEINGKIVLDEDICINCGWCQEICPVQAAEVSKPFEGEIYLKEDFTCKGDACHACVDVCPCNAISIVDNRSIINPKFCVLCGACAKACPQDGIVIKRSEIKLGNVRSKAWDARLNRLKELN